MSKCPKCNKSNFILDEQDVHVGGVSKKFKVIRCGENDCEVVITFFDNEIEELSKKLNHIETYETFKNKP